MNIFTKIKNKIFGHRPAAEMARQEQLRQQQTQLQPGGLGGGSATLQTQPAQQQQQSVDVEQVLTDIAREKGNPGLNWQTSIVDLMKLLDMDSSLENRKELAQELGYKGELTGSAEMNIWLHKAVMKQLAANGGKVPASMMD